MGKSKKLSWIGACVAGFFLLAWTGCGRADNSGEKHIALVTKALDSEFWQLVKQGAEEEIRRHPGFRLTVQAPQREINIDQQVSILEDLILRKVAALAVVPGGVAEVTPVLEKAQAAGIPVLLVDTDAPWPGKASYVGTDNRLGGKLAGEHMISALKGKGQVAVIRGVIGVATHEERLAGFREALEQAPGLEIVAVQPANSERPLAMSVMENLLTSHPKLAAVFATNDQMALGALEAVAARKMQGKVMMVGFDAGQEAVRAVDAGDLSAVVAQHPYDMGRRAVEEAVKLATGLRVEPRIDTGTTLITRDNARKFLR